MSKKDIFLFPLFRTILAIMSFALFSPAVTYAKDSVACAGNNQGLNIMNPQIISQVGAAINRLDISNQENCFEQLTANDKAFLNSLADKMSGACQSALKIKNAVSDCENSSRKTVNDAIENYRAKNGTAAKLRILTAIRAQAKKQQIAGILKTFQDPLIAPTFKKFADSMVRYEQSLANVTYQDIRPDDPESKWDAATVWMRQRSAMVIDLAKTKLSKTADSRYRENDRAAQQLLFSGIALNGKIKELKISEEEKKQLIDQVAILNSSMRDRYEGIHNKLGSEAKLAMVVSGGLASAALVVASAGTLAPAFISAAGGELSASAAGAALSGATGGAGVTGLTHVSDMALGAVAASKSNATSFVCELARRVDSDGEDALKDVWNSTWQGALMGGALGGTLGGVAKKAPKLAVALGAIMAAGGGVIAAESTRRNLDKIALANQKLATVKAARSEGKATDGDVRDVEAMTNQEKAHALASSVGDVATIGTLATGASNAVRGLKKTPSRSEVVRNARLDETARIAQASEILEKPITLNKRKAILEAHQVGEERADAGVYNYSQEEIIKKYRILRGEFSKEESKKLLFSGIAGKESPGFWSKMTKALLGEDSEELARRNAQIAQENKVREEQRIKEQREMTEQFRKDKAQMNGSPVELNQNGDLQMSGVTITGMRLGAGTTVVQSPGGGIVISSGSRSPNGVNVTSPSSISQPITPQMPKEGLSPPLPDRVNISKLDIPKPGKVDGIKKVVNPTSGKTEYVSNVPGIKLTPNGDGTYALEGGGMNIQKFNPAQMSIKVNIKENGEIGGVSMQSP